MQWQPFHDQSMAGYGMYQNALGLGGEAGTAAAQGAFQAGPGYQWNVDQATGQAARAANRYGGLYSGNTNEAMGRLASNLANQEYGNWVKNLSGFQGAAQTSSGALADIYGQQGKGLADLSAEPGPGFVPGCDSAGQPTVGPVRARRHRPGGPAHRPRPEHGEHAHRTGHGPLANTAGTYYGSSVNAMNRMYDTVIP